MFTRTTLQGSCLHSCVQYCRDHGCVHAYNIAEIMPVFTLTTLQGSCLCSRVQHCRDHVTLAQLDWCAFAHLITHFIEEVSTRGSCSLLLSGFARPEALYMSHLKTDDHKTHDDITQHSCLQRINSKPQSFNLCLGVCVTASWCKASTVASFLRQPKTELERPKDISCGSRWSTLCARQAAWLHTIPRS